MADVRFQTKLPRQPGERSNHDTRGRKHNKRVKEALDSGDVQGIIDNLSIRQQRFCEEYLVDFNGSAAVQRAGYNTKYPNKWGSELLHMPHIRMVIDHLTLQRASKSVIKPDYVINKITKTIEKAEADNNHSAVLRGCELLARHLGMFIERTEISGPNGDAIKYERVQEAADAFTSAIAGLVERAGEDEPFIVVGPKC